MCLAIPAKVIELFPGERSRALVEVTGVRRHIDIGLLEDDMPVPGDWVLIHVGFAMSKISEERGPGSDCRCWQCSAKAKPFCRKCKATAWRRDRHRTSHEICG